jgi:hypothetical protein
MAESVLGVLSVEITADADGLKRGLDASKSALQVGAKQLRSNLNEWGKWASAATLATGGVAAALVKSNLSNIRELKNLSFAANTTVADFQQMSFAANQYGIEQEKLGDILKDFNDRVGDFTATGAGPMVDFFEQIGPKVGVTINDFQKLSGPEGLQLFVSSLEKANLSQQDMTFYMEAIASDSTRLLPLLQNNGKAMSEQAKAARELGIGLSEIDVKKAEDAQKQLDAIGAFLSNELMIASAELAPLITEISKGFIDAAKESGGFAKNALDGFESVGSAVSVFANGIHGLKIAFKGVEVVLDGFLFAVSAGFNGVITLAYEVRNTLIDALVWPFRKALEAIAPFSDTAQSALDLINGIANTLKGEVPQAIRDFRDAQKEALLESRSELQALAMEKLPSEQFEEWLANVRSKIAETTEQLKDEVSPTGEGGKPAVVEELNKPAQLEQETIGILEALNIRFTSMEEAQLAAFEREKQLLDAQHKNKEISEEEHSKRMAEIKRQEEETKRKITTQNIQEGFQILAQGNKKFSKLIQNAAVVQATIKGGEAAVSAWSAGMAAGGPLLAAGYAIASIAKTKSMIDSIRSGGKSQPTAPSASVPSASGSQAQSTQSTQSVSKNFNINLTGGGMFSTSQVRELIGQINEQVGDGVQLNVTGG